MPRSLPSEFSDAPGRSGSDALSAVQNRSRVHTTRNGPHDQPAAAPVPLRRRTGPLFPQTSAKCPSRMEVYARSRGTRARELLRLLPVERVHGVRARQALERDFAGHAELEACADSAHVVADEDLTARGLGGDAGAKDHRPAVEVVVVANCLTAVHADAHLEPRDLGGPRVRVERTLEGDR